MQATAQQATRGDQDPAQQEAGFDKLGSNWGVYRPHELHERCERDGSERYLIGDLIAERSLGLLVGDSGLGKSPLAYQMALCVAAGVPFLGAAVRQTRVLYLDFEDGYRDVDDLITHLSSHLGLSALPRDLALWNINDSLPNWGQPGHTVLELIRDVKPGLVFIDPVSALYPTIEKSNTEATQVYQQFRKAIRDCGCSIFNLHHPRKQSSTEPVVSVSLEEDLRGFFQRVRGASVMVNGADVRLGVDRPGMSGTLGGQEEIALVLRGYGRVRGEIPTTHLARVFDQDGKPLGYRKVTGVELLCNQGQAEAFRRLPDRFEFKEAMRFYSRKDQATSDFLNKCIAKGILGKLARGVYGKVKVAE